MREKCEICGQLKNDVSLVTDPFQKEINDIEIDRLLCDDCYDGLRGDI